MVTKRSGSVLSQQSNSVDMPDHYSGSPKYLKLEHMRNTVTAANTVVDVSEDSRPLLSTGEEHYKSLESLESDILPMGDELSALFDSDNQKETDTKSATSAGKSNYSTLLYAVYCCV